MQHTEIREPLQLGPYYTRGIRFRAIKEAIEKEGPASLLNIGCQYGYIESVLPDEMQVLSLDNEVRYLETARAVNAGKPNRRFLHLDLFDLPTAVAPDSFDAVLMAEVIEHVADDVAALRVARRCLRPGGALFVTVPNLFRFPNRLRRFLGRKARFMTPNHLREYVLEDAAPLMARAGFDLESVYGMDFRLPLDGLVSKAVPIDFAGRRWMGERYPGMATYLMFIGRKPVKG